jgi:hypothetical protein
MNTDRPHLDHVTPPLTPPLTPAEPMSLQDHIHKVHDIRAGAEPPAKRRSTSKLVGAGAVIAAIVALWQFGPRFGWGPGGRGAGHGRGTDQTSRSVNDAAARLAASRQTAAPARPLRVTIDGNRYLVDGKEVDLETISKMADKVPAGEGPAVEVTRNGTSRVKAEQDLKSAIDQRHLPASWTPPLE